MACFSQIAPISAAQARVLRRAVLRAGREPESAVFPGDDAPGTVHLGAFSGDDLVAVLSLYDEGSDAMPPPHAWRLRGMATRPGLRGRGIGRALLDAGLAEVAARGGRRLWCNARDGAVAFYRQAGFTVLGDAFELPGIGRHYLMCRSVERVRKRPAKTL